MILIYSDAQKKKGNDFGGAYLKSAIILSSLWLFYPLIFGLADGGNIISPDAEIM